MTELKEICKVQCGFAFDSKKFTEDDSFSPLIRIRDVKRGFTQTYYTGEFSFEYIVHKGDLLVGMDGEFNIARWNSDDALLNQRVCRIIANNNVNEEYLRFYLKRTLKLIESKTSFVTVKHLSTKQLNGLRINLPCMEDQQRISKQLSTLELMIQKNKKVLELLDELVKARFVEMFGDPEDNPFKWDKMPLSNIMLNANNGMARRGNDENGNIVLRLVELQDGYIDYSNPNRICLNENEKKRYLLKNNDFLFARVNGNPDNVGRCAVFHDIGEDVYHNDHIIRVHFNEELLNGVFASELINSNFGKRQLKKRIKTSAGQYTVSQDGIGAIVSIVPPLELQNQFASFVQEVDKSRSRIQKSLEASQELFDSLMQEYFG